VQKASSFDTHTMSPKAMSKSKKISSTLAYQEDSLMQKHPFQLLLLHSNAAKEGKIPPPDLQIGVEAVVCIREPRQGAESLNENEQDLGIGRFFLRQAIYIIRRPYSCVTSRNVFIHNLLVIRVISSRSSSFAMIEIIYALPSSG